MKVYLSNYRNHWLSPYTILEKIYFWREIDYNEPFISKMNGILEPFCVVLQKVLDFVHPRFNYVKIDRWDTWSMDYTLAHIILPMLKQLRDTKHGSPNVDDDDVPDDLKRTAVPEVVEYETDSNWHLRWDWILNEMIWAFEQKLKDDDEDEFFDHTSCKGVPWDKEYVGPKIDLDGLKAHQKRKNNGYRLFGKYYQNLWD